MYNFDFIFRLKNCRKFNELSLFQLNMDIQNAKKHLAKWVKKAGDVLFSTRAAGLYMVIFAAAIGAATFIENDFGTSSAQKVIFKAWWFELLLVLFGITVVVNIFRFRMIQQKKWATLLFHTSIIIILLGSAITRYWGYEGMMHIREGSASDSFLSSDTYLQFRVMHNGRKYSFDEKVLFATLGDNRLKRSYLLDRDMLEAEVLGFLPNPAEAMAEDPNGVPVLKVVIAGPNGREDYYLKHGDKTNIGGTIFNFGNPEDGRAFNVQYRNDSLLFKPNTVYTQMEMTAQKVDTILPDAYRPLMLRRMYSNGLQSFVVGDFNPKATIAVNSSSPKMTSSSMSALRMNIRFKGEEQELLVVGSQGLEGRPEGAVFGTSSVSVAYGAKPIELPFSIKLHDFIMERYPGTNSASSYASEVTLADPRKNLVRDQRIFMNNILNYDGYRFFQSSFDKDELGTYLSVNHDFWGTWISYLGYALLTIGMVLVFFSNKSRFRQLVTNVEKMRQAEKVIAILLVGIFVGFATPGHCESNPRKIDTEHAARFGKLLMQDFNGRIKPMNTFSSEVLRKISRKERLYGMSPEQIVLGMAANPKEWYNVPIIKLGKNEEIRKLLNVQEDLIAYRDFFAPGGEYLLQNEVRAAYNMPQRDRGTFEKELLKLDEKVNICNMVFSGSFMSVFPVPGDKNHDWQSPVEDAPHPHPVSAEGSFSKKFYRAYIPSVQLAMQNNDWQTANLLIDELTQFQQKNGGEILPSPAQIKSEIFLNKTDIFNKLGKLYGLLSFVFLGFLFTRVFKPGINLKWPFYVAFGIFVAGFLMHTLGLGLRWYVSERAPWSNGYESMIYIGWTTTLAGLIFTRKSYGGLAATAVLSSVILMVAHLSFLDPEITPLVPVLKSYWLTIHVSMVAGSYGFLMLGAIIGVINLLLMIFGNQQNGKNVYRIIKEMDGISEMTLTGGLVMMSIGTYLGGVWANESWGRYWGWDAKETWALVTILVYAFILHMRFIPGLRGSYAYNVGTLFGLASVVMTYFGVNYYLSGLHSYAAGDPVPIPPFVYYTVAALTLVSLLAAWRRRVYLKGGG